MSARSALAVRQYNVIQVWFWFHSVPVLWGPHDSFTVVSTVYPSKNHIPFPLWKKGIFYPSYSMSIVLTRTYFYLILLFCIYLTVQLFAFISPLFLFHSHFTPFYLPPFHTFYSVDIGQYFSEGKGGYFPINKNLLPFVLPTPVAYLMSILCRYERILAGGLLHFLQAFYLL